MRRFECSVCHQDLFFENVQCRGCGHDLAYLPDLNMVSPLELVRPDPANDSATGAGASGEAGNVFVALAPEAAGRRIRLCDNYTGESVCNWAVSEFPPSGDANVSDAAAQTGEAPTLCSSCRLNQVIPNLDNAVARQAWFKIEGAKRRVLYSLQRLGLPLDEHLAFSFKEDQAGEKIYTGHDDGLITINIAEADDSYREKVRVELGESYRTVLGHVRHEIGHYYWDRLIAPDPAATEAFRKLFGDEREDYEAARDRHYQNGPLGNWHAEFVTAYAAMHPWEDWAESFAHLLHMLDTLETARSYGLAIQPSPEAEMKTNGTDFDRMTAAWFPLTIVLNCLNRSMGLPDSYPFVLPAPAIEKLRFVHAVITNAAASGSVTNTGDSTERSFGATAA